jgi:isocitrate/isopropylmalate dehydrogenase
MAMILAAGTLLTYLNEPKGTMAARAISESCLEAVYDGIRTADLRGHAGTTEYTDEVIRRARTKLEVWPSLSS